MFKRLLGIIFAAAVFVAAYSSPSSAQIFVVSTCGTVPAATLSGASYEAQCASGTTTITGMVQVTNAYVPANAEVLHIGLATVGAN
jgi:hypothetical protein